VRLWISGPTFLGDPEVMLEKNSHVRLRSEGTRGWQWMFLKETQFSFAIGPGRGCSHGAVVLPGMNLPHCCHTVQRYKGGPGREWMQTVLCWDSLPVLPSGIHVA